MSLESQSPESQPLESQPSASQPLESQPSASQPLESQPLEGQHLEGQPGRPGQRWRLLDDPVAIRALAHPLRHELMSIIASHGRATTADAARELGISHGLASHHLRQLAKYGFVEPVKGKDHRERPWRLVATSYKWSAATATPEGAYAVDVLERILAEQALDGFLEWQQRRRQWPDAWREHAGIGQSSIYLTLAELKGLSEDIDALILRYVNERPIDDVASRPAGSVPVNLTLFSVPGSGPGSGPDSGPPGEG
jgi:DNA-binding transcriptional ArsR family regulator